MNGQLRKVTKENKIEREEQQTYGKKKERAIIRNEIKREREREKDEQM